MTKDCTVIIIIIITNIIIIITILIVVVTNVTIAVQMEGERCQAEYRFRIIPAGTCDKGLYCHRHHHHHLHH